MTATDEISARDWHNALERALRAEWERDLLADTVLLDHDEHHLDNARWCTIAACRLAADRRRR